MGMFDGKKNSNACPNCGVALLGTVKECPKCHYDFALGKVPDVYVKRAEEQKAIEEAEAEVTRLRLEKKRLEEEQREQALADFAHNMLHFKTTTGFGFEGYKIIRQFNVQRGVCILGTGFLSEASAAFSDMFGASSTSMELKLKQAQKSAINDLIRECAAFGANAAIGVDIDIMTLANNMLVASATGTAVYIEEE